jgi:hypothetical protein
MNISSVAPPAPMQTPVVASASTAPDVQGPVAVDDAGAAPPAAMPPLPPGQGPRIDQIA